MNKKVTIEDFILNSGDPDCKELRCQNCSDKFKIENLFKLRIGGSSFKAYCSNCWDFEMNRRQMIDAQPALDKLSE